MSNNVQTLRSHNQRMPSAGALANKLAQLKRNLQFTWSEVRDNGFPTWLINRVVAHKANLRLVSVAARFPLYWRAGTSDIDVFIQVFGEYQYSGVSDLPNPQLVIDCGANVGYASAYFLSRWPRVKVISVEPDAQNFEVLEKNMQPYRKRVTLVNSGVWSHSCGLVMESESFRDGREWARRVRPAREGEQPQMIAVDVGSLLKTSGFDRVSILKIDVEGAEKEIFAGNYEPWIDKCDAIVIELHDDECERTFLNAIAGRGFQTSKNVESEITVARRPGTQS